MKYALIASMGLFIASCRAADTSLSLEQKVDEISTLVRSGKCDVAASLYDREIASTDLAPDGKIKLLTMIAGKYFENNLDDEGRRYAKQVAEIHNEPFREGVKLFATSALRMFDMHEKSAGLLITKNNELD